MDVEKTIEFLLANQARHEARYEERMGRLEAKVDSLAGSVGKLADHVVHLDDVMTTLAESHIKLVQRMDQFTERLDTVAQQSNERDNLLGQRIDSLVSAIGEFIRNRPSTG